MRHKDKEKPKEEQPGQKENEMVDFYGLLDTLLPQRNELLRTALENLRRQSEEKLIKKKGETDYFLELEKEKSNCLQQLLGIAVDQYLRVGADYANFQKRVPRQMADAIAYEKEKIIRTLLPVLDNFERTLQNAQSAENAENVLKGIKITYEQMLDILKSHGVEQIKALCEKFEPTLHEAIMQKDEVGKEEGIVLEELEKGYKLNDRVIRPSKVIVNKVTSKSEKASEQEETTDTE